MKNIKIVVVAVVSGLFLLAASAQAGRGVVDADLNGHDGGHINSSNDHDGGHVTPSNGHDGGH